MPPNGAETPASAPDFRRGRGRSDPCAIAAEPCHHLRGRGATATVGGSHEQAGTDPGGRVDRDDDPDPRRTGHGDLRRSSSVSNIGVLGVSLAFGLSLLCAAYLFGHISGCHINPAVTLGMWALKRTDGKDVPSYLVGQILGAAHRRVHHLRDPRDRRQHRQAAAQEAHPRGAVRRCVERLRRPLAVGLRVLGGGHHRGRVHRAVHPRDRGHHALVGHRRLRRASRSV